jgi:uncharacterized protein YggE
MKIRKIWLAPGAVMMAGVVAGLGTLFNQPANAASAPGPTLTVVGYSVVNVAPPSSNAGPQQLQINFQASADSAPAVLNVLRLDEVKVTAQLKKAGVGASAITLQGPPNLNIQNNVGYQANDTLQVNFPTLLQAAQVLQESGVANDANVQNVFVQPLNNPTSSPTAAVMTAGYQAAFANAQQTAQQMAQADNLQLGPAVSISEGSTSQTGCNPMGGCSPLTVGNLPSVGQNQQLVTVTVTYDTNS